MSRVKYFCSICQLSFDSPTVFVQDRQKHISKGEIKKENGKSKTITN